MACKQILYRGHSHPRKDAKSEGAAQPPAIQPTAIGSLRFSWCVLSFPFPLIHSQVLKETATISPNLVVILTYSSDECWIPQVPVGHS
jgi:hypothetical protein